MFGRGRHGRAFSEAIRGVKQPKGDSYIDGKDPDFNPDGHDTGKANPVKGYPAKFGKGVAEAGGVKAKPAKVKAKAKPASRTKVMNLAKKAY